MNKQQLMHMLMDAGRAYGALTPTALDEHFVAIDNNACDIFGFARRRGDLLIIAFRGSSTLRNWVTNFMFQKKVIAYGNDASPIRVHEGFLDAYTCERVRGRIHRLMTAQVRRVRITGHSLGAALAVLCAVDVQYNFPDRDIEVGLFGCPRVGNKAFANSYDRRVYKTLRVENGNDVVTKLPFEWMGYRHVGVPVRVGARRLPLAASAAAHAPQAYYARLLEMPT